MPHPTHPQRPPIQWALLRSHGFERTWDQPPFWEARAPGSSMRLSFNTEYADMEVTLGLYSSWKCERVVSQETIQLDANGSAWVRALHLHDKKKHNASRVLFYPFRAGQVSRRDGESD